MCSRKAAILLSPDARNDIEDILLFTRQRWGIDQRRQYRHRLTEVLDVVSRNPEIGLARAEISSGLRSFPIELHLILYRWDGRAISVLRVVHQNATSTKSFGRPKYLIRAQGDPGLGGRRAAVEGRSGIGATKRYCPARGIRRRVPGIAPGTHGALCTSGVRATVGARARTARPM
jgi:toxin ParE1/3/4